MLRRYLFPTVCLSLALPLCSQASHYQPRIDIEQGRFLKALADADARLQISDEDALAWASKSQALSSLTRFIEADAAAQKAISLNPTLADALMARSMASAGRALQQRNLGSLGKASQALSDLKEAVKSDPNYALAWVTLGLAYQQLPGLLGGSTRRALDCAEQLKRIQPARGEMLQAQVLSMSGAWGSAEPIFLKALAASPSDPGIVTAYLEELGSKTTRAKLGEEAQKQKLATEAVRLLPLHKKSARAVEAISQALLEAGKSEDAWEVAQESLHGVDAPSIVKLQLGKVSARTGLFLEEGLKYLEQAASEPLEGGTGGYASVHWRRGQVLRSLGRIEEARTAAQKALEYDSRHNGARELLSDLASSAAGK
ncbi:MAG: tetratricopeptide repeat protein [Holophagales bacterium]|jgi:tetratricopeptide (TPR) repeat protein|nr:tetratricopeptide repeat protein [Holophagales bacterium]